MEFTGQEETLKDRNQDLIKDNPLILDGKTPFFFSAQGTCKIAVYQ